MWKIISMVMKKHHHSLGQAYVETQTPYTAGTETWKLPGVSKNEAPSFNQDSNPLKCVVAFYMGYPTVGGTNLYYQQYLDSG
jgi:hypothetical protein